MNTNTPAKTTGTTLSVSFQRRPGALLPRRAAIPAKWRTSSPSSLTPARDGNIKRVSTVSVYRDVDGLLAEEQGLRESDETLQVSLVQWYPGHIARAERQLKEQLSKVDILLQVSNWSPTGHYHQKIFPHSRELNDN